MPRLPTDCKTMFCQIIVMLWLIKAASCDFLPVPEGCKYWDYLKVYGNGDEKHLHCILDQVYQSGLVYVEVKKIEKGRCPIYNRYAGQIDSIPCINATGDCPQNIIDSYEGVTYSGCYDNIWKKENSLMKPTTNKDGHTPSTPSASVDPCLRYQIPLVVMATLICTFIAQRVWHFICRLKIQLCKDECESVVKTNDDSEAPAEYKPDRHPLLKSGNIADVSPPSPNSDAEEAKRPCEISKESNNDPTTSKPNTKSGETVSLLQIKEKNHRK